MQADDLMTIMRLLADYCQTLDQRRIDDHMDLYVDDCCLEVFGRRFEGVERVRRFMDNSHAGQHLTGVPSITPSGEDAAEIASDFVFFREDLKLFTAGTYHDEVRRTDDGWRFVTRRIETRVGPPAE